MTGKMLMAGVAALAISGSAMAADSEEIMSRMAALEGEWMLLDENGEVTDIVGSTFRITASGSTLMERMFPDSPDGYEMLNVYHVDGDRVLMTHYCSAGNQPRLSAISTDEDRLRWEMESITNLADPGDDHMHQAEFVFHGDDRLTTHWNSMSGGELSDESATFELQRRQ